MKTIITISSFFLLLFCFTNCSQEPQPSNQDGQEETQPVPAEMTQSELVERGQYLVEVTGCNDCHTPKIMTPQGPAPNPELMLSGHPSDEQLVDISDKKVMVNYALFNHSLTAAIGPWGTSFSANLTPDDTGLGNWTLEQFEKALKEGKSKGMDGGRMLLPPMPWQNYRNMADDDLAAIWAYLQSIPPVKNVVPGPIPPAG